MSRRNARPKSGGKRKHKTLPGLVLSVLGKGYEVEVQGECWKCRVRGRLFLGDRSTRPVVGDLVEVEPRREPMVGVINSIAPRKSALARTFPETGGEQVLAANIDQVLICMAIKSPPFRPGLIDRYLVTCEALSLQPTLVVNKIDLATPQELEEATHEFLDIGYSVIFTSADQGAGVEELREAIDGRQSVFTGPSGAGKSSLANAIQPGLQLLTGEVNTVTGKGRHTTTVSRLIPISKGYIMDTPGIREFTPWGLDIEELPHCFVEFRPHLGGCQFRDCKHLAEPICGVKEAVLEGLISSRRYQSYVQLYEETLENTRPSYT